MNKTVETLPSLGFPLFELSLVTSRQVDDLKRGIGTPEVDCDPLAWIDNAVACNQMLVSVKSRWGNLPTGFAAFDTMSRRETQGEEWVAECSYNLHAVFVNPTFRGKGHGRALRRAISDIIETNVQTIQARGFANKVEIYLEAECTTTDGATFVRALVADCESTINKMSERRSADDTFGIVFVNCIDYGDYENEAGFSAPSP